MESRIYIGTIAHDRVRPVRNGFRYGVWFLYVDLAELVQLDASCKRFGYNRGLTASFRDRDHGPRDGSPLRPWIDGLLGRAGVDLEGGAVRILCFPRSFGFGFYPASFWYCFHADGTLRAVLAEVRNTLGGHHNYLLHAAGAELTPENAPRFEKVFRVSPFIPMGATYSFRTPAPGDTLTIAIRDLFDEGMLLIASVAATAEPFDDEHIMRALRRYGPMSLRAWLLIHRQAIRIIAKGIPFLNDRSTTAEETSL